MFTCPRVIAPVLIALTALLAPRRVNASDEDPFWGTDKALHFAVAGSIAGATYGATTAFTDDRWKAFAIGGGMAVGLGALKEGLDAAGLGDPSWKDFAWDVIGAAAGLGIAYAIDVAARGKASPAPGTARLQLQF
jgi:putative lipoprotein